MTLGPTMRMFGEAESIEKPVKGRTILYRVLDSGCRLPFKKHNFISCDHARRVGPRDNMPSTWSIPAQCNSIGGGCEQKARSGAPRQLRGSSRAVCGLATTRRSEGQLLTRVQKESVPRVLGVGSWPLPFQTAKQIQPNASIIVRLQTTVDSGCAIAAMQLPIAATTLTNKSETEEIRETRANRTASQRLRLQKSCHRKVATHISRRGLRESCFSRWWLRWQAGPAPGRLARWRDAILPGAAAATRRHSCGNIEGEGNVRNNIQQKDQLSIKR